MRLLHVADVHFDRTSRWEETLRLTQEIVEIAEREAVGLITIGGDIFERQSTPEERNAVAAWLEDLATFAPVVGVYGNHDSPLDLDIFQRIEAKHRIIFAARPAVHVVAGTAVACLPWPQKAQLLAALDRPAGVEETGAIASELLRDVLRGLGERLAAHDGPRVLLAHAMVDGSRTSAGQPLVGLELSISLSDLELAGADVVLLGHIHCGQEWTLSNGAPVIYPGSPRRTAFGELEAKGAVIVQLEKLAGVTSIETVELSTTPMLLIESTWASAGEGLEPGWFGVSGGDEAAVRAGAECRFRYTVAADYRATAALAAGAFRAELLAAGASVVKVEEQVVPVVRQRDAAIAAARSLSAKTDAYWTATGRELEPPARARMLAAIDELERQVR